MQEVCIEMTEQGPSSPGRMGKERQKKPATPSTPPPPSNRSTETYQAVWYLAWEAQYNGWVEGVGQKMTQEFPNKSNLQPPSDIRV